MTVFKDTREEAKTIIDTAIKLANKEAVEVNSGVNNGKINVPSILLTPIAVDINNINDILIQSKYYNPSEVYSSP